MLHAKYRDTNHLLTLSEHANLHGTHLSIYVTTIAVNYLYLDCHAKAVLYSLMTYIYNFNIIFKTT